ncbi:MAG: hypothetical protein ACE5LB_08020, partial [Acidiferrobacterales bacterium]
MLTHARVADETRSPVLENLGISVYSYRSSVHPLAVPYWSQARRRQHKATGEAPLADRLRPGRG